MKHIAIIGSGISGLSAAWRLKDKCRVSVYEAQERLGGHTHTHAVPDATGKKLAIDSGFIVFNDWTYPRFIALLNELGVESQPSDMSFAVKCERTGLEYNGTSLNTLFAQRRNLFKPFFWGMVRDILRFNREGTEWLKTAHADAADTLGDFIARHRFSQLCVDKYILPITAAIWSASPSDVLKMPLRFYLRFCANHGMLSVDKRPLWRVVKGGSRSYVDKIRAALGDVFRIADPVLSLRRLPEGGVEVTSKSGVETYDGVVIACHSDEALKLWGEHATPLERDILGALPYQRNEAVLHRDASLMPKRRLAWAAWNYHVLAAERPTEGPVALTYNMNILQSLPSDETWLVTLNNSAAIDPTKVVRKIEYHHPVFTLTGIRAQERWSEISGPAGVHYAGAYWRFGFHEDGCMSGERAAEQISGSEGVGSKGVNS